MSKSDQSHNYAVIFAGGSGTRLWPSSTVRSPKQFQRLGDERVLLERVFDSISPIVPPGHLLVSTTHEYAATVRCILPFLPERCLVIEPVAVGKPAAYLLAVYRVFAEDPDAIIITSAADSIVSPLDGLHTALTSAQAYVRANIGTLSIIGIRPTGTDVSLGYIHARPDLKRKDPGILEVLGFHEKPQLSEANVMASSGEHFWNTSFYCFAAKTLIEAYSSAAPMLTEGVSSFVQDGLEESYRDFGEAGHELTPLVMHGTRMALIPADVHWSDIGTWPSLYRSLRDASDSSYVSMGRNLDLGSESSLVVNEQGVTVFTVGLRNLLVVVSDEAVLVAQLDLVERHPEMLAQFQKQVKQDDESGVQG